jgi:hypothetical protein
MTIKTSVIQGEVQKSVHFCRVVAATGAAINYGCSAHKNKSTVAILLFLM